MYTVWQNVYFAFFVCKSKIKRLITSKKNVRFYLGNLHPDNVTGFFRELFSSASFYTHPQALLSFLWLVEICVCQSRLGCSLVHCLAESPATPRTSSPLPLCALSGTGDLNHAANMMGRPVLVLSECLFHYSIWKCESVAFKWACSGLRRKNTSFIHASLLGC